jgi:hypothetical protein
MPSFRPPAPSSPIAAPTNTPTVGTATITTANSGPRQLVQTQIDAVDGAGHSRNGAWDYMALGFNLTKRREARPRT